MAKFDTRKLAKRAAGRPFEPMWGVTSTFQGNGTATLTGIKVGDGLISVLKFEAPTSPDSKAISEDLVATTSILEDGEIYISGTVSFNDNSQLLVHWFKF